MTGDGAHADQQASVTNPDDLLVAAVELVADTVDASAPRAMRKRLLSGLVDDLGMEAAMLWAPLERDEGLALLDNVGLSGELTELLAAWPAESTADRIARSVPRPADGLAVSHAPVPGLKQTLYVMALPEPATELLGVLARRPIDAAFTRLLAALGRAYASAVRHVALLQDNQRIVDSLVDDLRPGDVLLPDGYAVGHLYRSATANVAIGGDLYDWFCTDRGDLGVAIGDVSGKGMQAASRAAMAVHSLRALALPGAAPHVMAQMLNTIVGGQSDAESFVTLIYLRIEPDTARTEFVLAGHPPPVLLRGTSAEVVDAPADLPLGIDGTGTFAVHQMQLEPGDRVVLYTDGVTEARSAEDGSLLGVTGLTALLRDAVGRTPQEVADAVWAGVQAFTGGDTTDDCAVLVLGRD
ncbi:MAG TPA: PP2C family protein-serine/threonine phosphatase [Euzebyales bacterium]